MTRIAGLESWEEEEEGARLWPFQPKGGHVCRQLELPRSNTKRESTVTAEVHLALCCLRDLEACEELYSVPNEDLCFAFSFPSFFCLRSCKADLAYLGPSASFSTRLASTCVAKDLEGGLVVGLAERQGEREETAINVCRYTY